MNRSRPRFGCRGGIFNQQLYDTVAAIIHVHRVFETKVADEIKCFDLIHSLLGKNAPDLRIIISDGRLLYFPLATTCLGP